jgi:exodeoxyribonuclease VII large subunit
MREAGVRKLDYDEDAGVVVVSFPYDPGLNAVLKSEIPGMRWDGGSKRWVVASKQALKAAKVLRSRGFTIGPAFESNFPQELATIGEPCAGDGTNPELIEASLPRSAVTISDVVARISRALAREFPAPIWVVGTLLGFDKIAQRDMRSYSFNLADCDLDGKPTHQLDAVMWPDTYQAVQAKFRAAGVELRDTLPVLFKVGVRMWEAAGKLQLYVEDADPSYTVGKILKNLDAIHDRLLAEGLAERNLGLPWPELPLRVGLITSPKDGFGDFHKILSLSGFPFVIYYAESRVQGPETAAGVTAALERLAREELDCIAIIRGGGANADLSWFNDYAIGRAISLCPVPVIAGIGHDRDETLPDRLARSRSNPTAVAQALVKQVRDACQARERRAAGAMQRVRVVFGLTGAKLRQRGQQLELLVQSRLAGLRQHLLLDRHALGNLGLRPFAHAKARDLPLREQRLTLAATRAIERARHRMESAERDLQAHDPAKLLSRGFARVTGVRGRVIRKAADLALGDTVNLSFADGKASARVETVAMCQSASDRPSEETTP